MQEILLKKINSYQVADFNFLGCDCFINHDNSFILNRHSGTSMIISNDILEKISSSNLDESIKFKLIQKGFAIVQNSNEIQYDFEDKFNLPRSFLIELTKKCNLHCRYCFRDFNLTKNNEEISYSEINFICQYILNYCKKYNIRNITLQGWGGEPLLCLDKLVYIKNFFKKSDVKIDIMIQTNATLITKNIARVLKDNQFGVGISIDGFESVQNLQRPYSDGRKSFNDVMRGIKNLNEVSQKFGVISIITKESLPYTEKIIEFLANDLKANSIKLNIMHANKHADNNMAINNSEISLFIDKMLNKLINLNENGIHITESNISSKLKNLLIRVSGSICKMAGCNGGKQLISFDKNGNVYPCELTDHSDEILGNIHTEESLPLLIQKGSKNKKYFQNKKIPECDECTYYCFCKGGCSAAVKYSNYECAIDIQECYVNKELYPKLIKLILDKPKTVEKMVDKSIVFCN
jgi:uncharacterized protein